MTNITRPGVADIEGRDRDDMIAAAKKYIDGLFPKN
jgi:hypothetical protein